MLTFLRNGNKAQGTRLIMWSLLSNICTTDWIIFSEFILREDQKTKFQVKYKKWTFRWLATEPKVPDLLYGLYLVTYVQLNVSFFMYLKWERTRRPNIQRSTKSGLLVIGKRTQGTRLIIKSLLRTSVQLIVSFFMYLKWEKTRRPNLKESTKMGLLID